MKFSLHIDSDNDAMNVGELVRLLNVAILRLDTGADEGSLLDINGNTVGFFRIEED